MKKAERSAANNWGIRTQYDGRGDEMSRLGALDCQGRPGNNNDLVRQEQAADADINNILKKFGVDPFMQRQPVWGSEINYDADLQESLHAVEDSKRAYYRSPQVIRDKFPTWQSFVAAIQNGDLAEHLAQLDAADRKKTPPPEPALDPGEKKTAPPEGKPKE